MRRNKISLLALLFICFYACKNDDIGNQQEILSSLAESPNVLLIIADDFGLDACPGYSLGSVKPNMPVLQSMINSGIRFNNVWANPTCTPTRSTILTGKYGVRTNVTKVGDELSTSESSLQQYIGSDYAKAVIGKWHLSSDANHPLNFGLDYYAGLLTGAVQSYTNWTFTENGQSSTSLEYTTTKFTDLAIDWTAQQSKPWFLWLAYNAPHTPFHLPPDSLHSQGALPSDAASIAATPLPYFMAMCEAMDSEMGRLINSLSQEERDNTIIIFIGDNGTTGQVAQEYNSNRVKGKVYQGGINVPMIIAGKGITRKNEAEDALINSTDLFATISTLTGTSVSSINDSKNFSHLLSNTGPFRDYAYSEIGYTATTSDYTIRNSTHKYIRFQDGTEALFDLSANPLEQPNLLGPIQPMLSNADSLVLDELKKKVIEIRQ
ncbi:MAG: sulfatase-like hydrolase/transferase [Flavobacteriales bacterium]|nr:sulfatase-like hydrolase/transferase [Flavobacteriales bacterium]